MPRLLDDYERCLQPALNLLLIGRATPYLHNGKVHHGSDGQLLVSLHPHIKIDFKFFDFTFYFKNLKFD